MRKILKKYNKNNIMFNLITMVVSVVVSLILLKPGLAFDVTLTWDGNLEPDLAGYNLYYKTGFSGPPYNGQGLPEGNSPIMVENVTTFTLHELNEAETYFFVVTAYDTSNLESDYSNEVNTTGLIATPDTQAPVPDLAVLPEAVGECMITLIPPTAKDNCSGSITATTDDPTTYTIPGTYTITWLYDDDHGNTASQTQQAVITDTQAPVPDSASLPPMSAECKITLIPPTATDNCSGSITATTDDPTTYTIPDTYTITWLYDDGHGNTASQTQQAVITDTQAPVPASASLPEVVADYKTTLFPPTASDNCSGLIVARTNDSTTYTRKGNYSVTWLFDDNYGNLITQTQAVIITNTQSRELEVSPLPDIIAECEVTLIPPFINDTCQGQITATTSDPLTYSSQGTYTVNWLYDDGFGNTTTQVQRVVIDDTTPPAPDLATLSAAIAECELTLTPPTATDFCGGQITATTSDPLTYSSQGTYTVNWLYDDGFGNTTTQVQRVVIDDTTPPAPDLATLPKIIGKGPITLIPPKATDICLGSVTAKTNDPLVYTTPGQYTVNWIYDDGHGNSTLQTQQVEVIPNQLPIAQANGPYSGEIGSLITFSASGSYDPDGTIILYEWDWDNNGSYDDQTTSTTISHTFRNAFSGAIVLRVTDHEGGYASDNASLEVKTPPSTVRGDLDGDGDVDYDDFIVLRASYGFCEGDSSFNPKADLDEDGCVTINDYIILRSLMGE